MLAVPPCVRRGAAASRHLSPHARRGEDAVGRGNGAQPVGDYCPRGQPWRLHSREVRSEAPGPIRSAARPPALTCPGSLVGPLPDVLFPIVACYSWEQCRAAAVKCQIGSGGGDQRCIYPFGIHRRMVAAQGWEVGTSGVRWTCMLCPCRFGNASSTLADGSPPAGGTRSRHGANERRNPPESELQGSNETASEQAEAIEGEREQRCQTTGIPRCHRRHGVDGTVLTP